MKTALIIVSSALAIVTGVGIYLFVNNRKMSKKLSDPKALWNEYLQTLPAYATNADALEAGLKVGDQYRTPDNNVAIVVAATSNG